ncbi:hypothetical protein HDU96_002272 [Phlyctochytrium bullatum]|nr:hypothetical protein HDU96_002272 [Phlyctochytrium bullatum]
MLASAVGKITRVLGETRVPRHLIFALATRRQQHTHGMDVEEFRRRGHETVERIARYYETLKDHKVLSTVQPGYLAPQLPTEAPEFPESFDEIAKDFDEKILPGITHWFNWQTSPACTELETVVLDWMGKAVGLDESFLSKGDGGGVIQGTASEAVAVAVIAARKRMLDILKEKHGLDDEEVLKFHSKLIAYGSSETHSCTQKASMIAGVVFRKIPVDDQQRIRGSAVRKAIEEDIAKGYIPFYLTATIGTTSSGAVDAIPEVVEALQGTDVWLHIDAAWAGSALVCDEFAHHRAGVNGADSFNFNMHKWMLTNFDCSPMWVKRRKYLVDALSVTPIYLRNPSSQSGLVTDYRDWQSLKIWFVVRTYGLEGIRAHIRKHVSQAHQMAELLGTQPDTYRLITGPNFALITFQVLHPGNAPSGFPDANTLTKRVYEKINEEGTIYLTHTRVADKDLIRFVAGSPWTTDKDVEEAFHVIKRITQNVIDQTLQSVSGDKL